MEAKYVERFVMNTQPNKDPDYGVRLTGEELAEHQQRQQQPQPGSAAASEYGPQGSHAASEYGPQGGQAYPPQPGHQPPGFQQPGQPHPGYQPPGYQQPPAGGYGQQPFGGPQLHPDMAKEPERPKTVNIAFWSIVAAGIAYLMTQLIMLSLPNRGVDEAQLQMLEREMGPLLDQTPFDSITAMMNSPMMTASMVIQAIVVTVIYFLVALGIRHGWRSMRIVATIFAVFSLFAVLNLASTMTLILSLIAIALGIIGVVYAWLPATTEYFRRKAWQKAAKRAYPDVPSR
jgi:hypothetical protein